MDDNKLNTLRQFLSMGWSLIPLHDVAGIVGGECSCGRGADCPPGSRGKHPRNAGWQRGGWVREAGVLASIVRDRPAWNWGAVTGTPSGFWALDVDPRHGGMEALSELLAEAGIVRERPCARVHGTGSGGQHLLFAIGDDGWMPRTGAGRIGPGLDVRAEGGQIVLPPSVSSAGPYVELISAYPRVAPAELRAEIERRLAPTFRSLPPVARAEVQPDAVLERGEAYANRVVLAEVAELEAAEVGTRNDTAYRTACRVLEIVNAPWNSWTADRVFALWYSAAVVTGAPDGEVHGVWHRAAARVGEAAAELPESTMGGDRVPFPGSPTPAPFRESAGHGGDGQRDDPVSAFLDAMLTPEDLEARPVPVPLVEGLLFLDTCAWLIGRSGSLKSFVALDLAAHVGRGDPWQGAAVEQGEVWYIVGEGLGGMKLRVGAWRAEYGDMKDVRFVPAPVQADERRGGGGWTVLVAAAAVRRPRLVVMDTQARGTIGLDENSNTDMSYFAAQADRLRAASGACVLIVHHMGAGSTGRARGATAIDGAQDTELRITRQDKALSLTLHVDKQKDAPELPDIALEVRPSLESLVLAPGAAVADVLSAPTSAAQSGGVLAPFRETPSPVMSEGDARALAMYRVILDVFQAGEGGTRAQVKSLFTDLPAIARLAPATRKRARDRAWTDLVRRGLLMRADRAERFKVVILPNQSESGALTTNHKSDGWMPPDGWQVIWPDDDAE